MNLTLAQAAMGAGAVLEAPASVPNAGALVPTGYSIDSRTVAPGELFFAVRGERHDGHDFVAAAFERGAVAAVVSRVRAASLPDAALANPLLIADDPLTALQALALHVRRGTDPQGLPLTYQWSLINRPPNSMAVLSSTSVAKPTFVADLPGLYTAQLVVNNTFLSSPPSTVNITTTNTPPVANAGPNQNVTTGIAVS